MVPTFSCHGHTIGQQSHTNILYSLLLANFKLFIDLLINLIL
jgi:hypothetical protein